MSDEVIAAEGLTRYFGERAAVEGVDLSVPRGSVCALIGRNGSGKTTTIRMLVTQVDREGRLWHFTSARLADDAPPTLLRVVSLEDPPLPADQRLGTLPLHRLPRGPRDLLGAGGREKLFYWLPVLGAGKERFREDFFSNRPRDWCSATHRPPYSSATVMGNCFPASG